MTVVAPAASAGSTITGTGVLLRLLLRRDRVRIAVWCVAIVGLVAAGTVSVIEVYPTLESLQNYAALARGNTIIIIQAGPGHGLFPDPTQAAVVLNEAGIWTLIAVSVMSSFMVIRHTRLEEETGRAELVRAAPVGRHAAAIAALIGVAIANVVVSTGVALVFVFAGFGVAGAVAFAAAMVGTAMTFAGVALVAGQVASSARAANGLGLAAVATAFLLRAVGDVNDGRLSWLSPIGWGQAVRAYADERWWVLALPVVATAGLLVLADSLTSHRDLGRGLVPQRPGRAAAAPSLRSTLALAVRLQRGAFIGWVAGLAVIAVFYGVVADEADQLVADNPELEEFFAMVGEGAIIERFLSTSILLLALAASGFTVSSVLRLRGEEADGRLEPLLATPLERRRWMAGHVIVSVVGTVVLMAVTGALLGTGLAVAAGEPSWIPRLTGAALAAVPAMLVLGAIAAVLFGVLPRWTLFAWGGLVGVIVLGVLGEVLQLPGWLLDASPFAHVPPLPGGTFTVLPLAILAAVGAAVAAAGFAGFGRRDVG